jgi:alcohol dehydrogenase class IV
MTTLSANYNYPVSYRIGCGRIGELAEICKELGSARPLIVTDPGIVGLPWFAGIVEALEAAGLAAKVFSEVEANPAEADVLRGVAAYKAGDHDACVLIGGGSAIDVGKCVALMVGNAGSVFDYEDVGDNWTLADPELSYGLPPHLTAATGMDALAHCFEAYCAPGYHPMADGIALEGMRLIRTHLPIVFKDPSNAESRTHMMLAASMGATAFQKGLGLVHALSHPLGGACGVHHGLANAVFLPYVMKFNRAEIEDKMIHLARVLELDTPGFGGVMKWMLELREQLGLPHTLAGTPGFDEAKAKELAPLAARDPSMGGNPRGATLEELEQCFLDALRGTL